mgnify:CR=1 FL=1|jgi:hypothetical protein
MKQLVCCAFAIVMVFLGGCDTTPAPESHAADAPGLKQSLDYLLRTASKADHADPHWQTMAAQARELIATGRVNMAVEELNRMRNRQSRRAQAWHWMIVDRDGQPTGIQRSNGMYYILVDARGPHDVPVVDDFWDNETGALVRASQFAVAVTETAYHKIAEQKRTGTLHQAVLASKQPGYLEVAANYAIAHPIKRIAKPSTR